MTEYSSYFVSDAHLGLSYPGWEGREEALISFLRAIAPGAEALFIVGDLFDFWVEYRSTIRRDYFGVLHALRTLVEEGVAVHYLRGNHDFALGNFLSETIGARVHAGPAEVSIQGKKVYLRHADGIRRAESLWRLLDRILRSRADQFLFRLLHPTLGIRMGEFFSGLSRRQMTHPPSEAMLQEYRDLARSRLEGGDEIVVFGHTHVPELIRFGRGVYCNTGAWLARRSFARMTGGEISLWEYREGGKPVPIPERAELGG